MCPPRTSTFGFAEVPVDVLVPLIMKEEIVDVLLPDVVKEVFERISGFPSGAHVRSHRKQKVDVRAPHVVEEVLLGILDTPQDLPCVACHEGGP